MTDPDDVGITRRTSAVPSSATGRLARTLATVLCLCALTLSFVGLFEWDVPLTRFVRSLNDVQIDHLANPWLARLSDVGDRLGKGESLVVLSVAVLAVGYALKQAVWKTAGWQSLIAHGLAAVISNGVKHLVGRPRPKFMHAGHLDLSPAGGSGWDSFPSGHATASFAVASVCAARFPKVRWAIYCVAAAIAVSRVLRGAHFLTDAVGGATLGCLVGTIAAAPWRDWRSSFESALFAVTPYPAALLAFVWTISHRPTGLWPSSELIGVGVFVTAVGLGWQALRAVMPVAGPKWLSKSLVQDIVGLGLGMATGSLWVVVTVACFCLALELRRGSLRSSAVSGTKQDPPSTMNETALFILSLVALLAIIGLRGVLPMV